MSENAFDLHSSVYLGPVRVEMDKNGISYVRFRARELAEGAFATAKRICKKQGFVYDGVNAWEGPGWKLASLCKALRTAGFTPLMGASVVHAMGRLAASNDYATASERADARMDAIEAASGKKYRDYQRQDARWMEAAGSCVLANEMRTGKTPTCLAMVPPEGAVIVCPVGVKQTWAQHVREWLPWMTVVLNGNPEEVRPNEVVITNYERLPIQKDWSIFSKILLVADEAQALKNLNANRTQAFQSLARCVSDVGGRVILASGTPAKNGRWQEFWALLSILQLGERVFGNSRSFAKEWREYYSPDKPIVGPLSRLMTRRTYAEVVGYLPPFTWSNRPVSWDSLADSGWCSEDDRDFAEESESVRSKLSSLWDRFSNAPDVYAAMHADPKSIGEYSTLRRRMAYLKAEEASAWAYEMWEAGVPCLVCGCHRESIQAVASSLEQAGVRVGVLMGGVSERVREEVRSGFQGGTIDVVCFTTTAGGVGIDLSRADAIGVIDLSFVPGDNDQAFARLMSVADPRPKTGVRFVLDHPLEEAVDRILMRKCKVIEGTVGQVKNGSRTYGQDMFGDLQSGEVSSGVPEGVDLGELSEMLKGL